MSILISVPKINTLSQTHQCLNCSKLEKSSHTHITFSYALAGGIHNILNYCWLDQCYPKCWYKVTPTVKLLSFFILSNMTHTSLDLDLP